MLWWNPKADRTDSCAIPERAAVIRAWQCYCLRGSDSSGVIPVPCGMNPRCRPVATWCSSTGRGYPLRAPPSVYQFRSARSPTWSSSVQTWPQGNSLRVVGEVGSGHATAKTGIYCRLEGDRPFMSGNSRRRSPANRLITPDPPRLVLPRGQDQPTDPPVPGQQFHALPAVLAPDDPDRAEVVALRAAIRVRITEITIVSAGPRGRPSTYSMKAELNLPAEPGLPERAAVLFGCVLASGCETEKHCAIIGLRRCT